MNVGLGQTGGTCWFNSSLNIFLTSDNGLKVLWDKLRRVYPRLGPKQKAYFNSNIGVPCPYMKTNKTPRVYFWKFLNQYICAVGGPGSLIPKSGLNAYLLKNIKWKNEATRESKGVAGGWPHYELPTILTHLGFRRGAEYRVVAISSHKYKFSREWTNPILVLHGEWSKNHYSGIPLPEAPKNNNKEPKSKENVGLVLTKGMYELTGAVVYVEPAENSNRRPHVWSCSIRNGKGYITDSNYPMNFRECSWWLNGAVKRALSSVGVDYRPNRAKKMVFDVLLYTRKDYTNALAPYCLMPAGGYRPLTNNNKGKLAQFQRNWGTAGVNFLKTGGVGEAHRQFAPRVLTQAIRNNAAKPFLTAAHFNAILNEAGSFNHGMRVVNRAVHHEGFKVNKNGPNFKNFRKKLAAKFPRPVPKSMFMYFWKNSNSNSAFVNRIRNYANRAGYTVNETELRNILNRRATTRGGVKRVRNAAEERMYLVNNSAWYNINGTNVTNRINDNNWTLTNNNNVTPLVKNHTNATNVKTYKRKVANFNAARAKAARRR
jgi:hypothetical protein